MACIHLMKEINYANSTYQGPLIYSFLSHSKKFANKKKYIIFIHTLSTAPHLVLLPKGPVDLSFHPSAKHGNNYKVCLSPVGVLNINLIYFSHHFFHSQKHLKGSSQSSFKSIIL